MDSDWKANGRACIPYALAAAAYVTAGVAYPDLLLSSAEGILFLLLAVWAIPAGIGRVRAMAMAKRSGGAGGGP